MPDRDAWSYFSIQKSTSVGKLLEDGGYMQTLRSCVTLRALSRPEMGCPAGAGAGRSDREAR